MSHQFRLSPLTAWRRHSVWPCLCVALCGVPPAWAGPASAEQADSVWLAASDAQLSALRGGFQSGDGLMVSFGISRVAYINDRLVASTTLNLGDLNRLTAKPADRLSQPLRPALSATVQPPAWVTVMPPGAATQPPPAFDKALPLPQALQSLDPPQVLVGPQTAVQAQVLQNGRGNVVQALDLPWATVVQNSLNDQLLRTQTVIHVSSNGLGALRYLNLQNTLDIALRARQGLR
jgi:hypothetical protein